jgi:hypothetical protein
MNLEKRLKTIESKWTQEEIQEAFEHIDKLYDAMHRLEGGQIYDFSQVLEDERQRTQNFGNSNTLANDTLGYRAIEILAILTHPCQKCSEDVNAWHTRVGFCNHEDGDN